MHTLSVSALGSRPVALSARGVAVALGVLSLLCGAAARAQPPSFPGFHAEFSTHDHTTTAGSPTDLRETWNDVKTSGDGRTYAVGTIEVVTSDDLGPFPARYSGKPVGRPIGLPPFTITAPGVTKEIVILQCSARQATSPAQNGDQDIKLQVHFYGDSGVLDLAPRRHATHARAISVFPVALPDGTLDEVNTRIAICGETFDSILPNNQFNGASGWTKIFGNAAVIGPYPFGLPNGYIAVFRGDGVLLWSHQFFFQDQGNPNPEGACAITDVSIRVEGTGDDAHDIVTYCGISSFGDRTNDPIPPDITALTPFRSFVYPVPPAPTGYVPAGGSIDNGRGEWDGIVGRLSKLHNNSGSTVKEFHAVVVGALQDGLWGIAELDVNRFVVVGGTAVTSRTGTPNGRPAFPFVAGGTNSFDWSNLPAYCVATSLVFDATPTRTGGNLVLESSAAMGSIGEEFHTHAVDVAVQLHAVSLPPFPVPRIAVVGTTDDGPIPANPLGVFGSTWHGPINFPSTVAFQGPTDGYLVTIQDLNLVGGPGTGVPFHLGGAFQDVPGASGWCGVGVWNEYLDHPCVAGWGPSPDPINNLQDTDVASILVDTPTQTPTPSEALLRLRGGAVVAAPLDRPAQTGAINATLQRAGGTPSPIGLQYFDFALFGDGLVAGGGVAVDERGRVNVVGATSTAPGIPVVGAGTMPPMARNHRGGQDATRTVVSMLPVLVGRSDGTGQQSHSTGTIPPPPTGMTGRTTPTCALLPFGTQIVLPVVLPVPPLPRMLLDWQGPAPGATPTYPNPPAIHHLLLDRPRSDTQAWLSVIQFGVPTPVAPGPDGLERWVPSGVTQNFQFVTNPLSVRIPLLLPPAAPGTATFSMQVVTFLATPLACTGFSLAASPAIVFSY